MAADGDNISTLAEVFRAAVAAHAEAVRDGEAPARPISLRRAATAVAIIIMDSRRSARVYLGDLSARNLDVEIGAAVARHGAKAIAVEVETLATRLGHSLQWWRGSLTDDGRASKGMEEGTGPWLR